MKKDKKGSGIPKISKVEERVMDVKHTFDSKEKEGLSVELVTKMTTRAQLEEQRESVNSEYKSKIKLLDAEISVNHSKLTNGYEYRQKPCMVAFNTGTDAKGKPCPRPGWKRITLKETGDFLKDEPMTPTDLNAELFEQKKIEEESKRAKDAKNGLNQPQVPEKAGEKSSTAAQA